MTTSTRQSSVSILMAAMVCWLVCIPATAQAAPPAISSTTFSGVTETSANLEAKVDPQGANIKDAHFEFLPLTAYEADGETFGEGTQNTPKVKLPASVKGTGDVEASSPLITNLVTTNTGIFAVGQTIKGEGIPAATTIVKLTATTLTLSNPATATHSGVELTATGPQPLAAALTGLAPGTGYVFRASAESGSGETAESPAITFYTYAEAPTFGPCPNEAFRTGELAPFGHPSALLPDCRAYEQVSPVDKNGNEAVGEYGISRASVDGSAATFLSGSGIPGGEGAQGIPTYVATRGPEGWTTHGLLPQGSAGYAGAVRGWTPDFKKTFTSASRLGPKGREAAFLVRTDPGSSAAQVSAYVPGGAYSYVGASADEQTVIFEGAVALPPKEGQPPIALAQTELPNVYAYDAASELVFLASVMNTPEETELLLPKGASTGAAGGAYTQDNHAVTADGSVFFTGQKQLYERINPTQPQSALDGEGNCTEPARACTIHISTSEKTNGTGPGGSDSAGAQAATFQAATPDGSEAFFTSSEKLTNDANTGKEQPPAQIGSADITAEDPQDTLNESFLPAHALGVAVDPKGKYIYWAEPVKGTIGRANLKAPNPAATVEDEYIVPGPVKCEVEESEPAEFEETKTTPRYVAVDEEHVYWTNSSCLDSAGRARKEGGTIGRAAIDGKKESIEPEFITGATNPQGIAVNEESIYWANERGLSTVGRASIDGKEVNQAFVDVIGDDALRPVGVALDSSYVYYTANWGDLEDEGSSVRRVPLAGGEEEHLGIGATSKLRGIAVDGSSVYWVAQGEEVIGRIPITDFAKAGNCSESSSCERETLNPTGSVLGLAADGSHLYWSVNGESPGNPGSDLYRSSVAPDSEGHHLTDLTPDSADTNGAEVLGVLGVTPDGSYLYFVANADLDGEGPAAKGTCQSSPNEVTGRCSIYLLHDGETRFVAPLQMEGPSLSSDASNFTTVMGREGEKNSFLTPDGTLVFRSEDPESAVSSRRWGYYRYVPGQGGLSCLTCIPTGETAEGARPSGSHIEVPGYAVASPAATFNRYLSSDGRRFFFQTTARLVADDPKGGVECGVCDDVYEWEAPGSGSCKEGGPAYSPLNNGCLYLLSSGTDEYSSYLSAASTDGSSVFLFTFDQLVGQDSDGILDLYVAREGGGIATQNPIAKEPCEGEGCMPPVANPPNESSPQTSNFIGPENPKRPKCPKGKILKKGKCQKKPKPRTHKGAKHHHRAGHRGGQR